jgi:DDE superfamily endonuclease
VPPASLLSSQIKLQNRFKGDTQQRALMVIDGIDFAINEPRKNGFNKNWYSHKFSGPGVRYELGTCINTGEIVWFHGPFPCGSHPDLKIYRLGLKRLLNILEGERVWGDKGYRGDLSTITRYDAVSREHKKEMGRARARHETVNGRFADFGALKNVWRHDLNKHYLAYCSIAIITQLETTNGFPPFECFSQHHSAITNVV